MDSFHLLQSTLSPIRLSHSKFPGKSGWIFPELSLQKRVVKFQTCGCFKIRKIVRVVCKAQDTENQSNDEEPPESLFMKELKRRGMTPTSLLEESKQRTYNPEEDINLKEENQGFSKRNAISTDVEKSLSNQRERSMALNSEGLEGLIPRAKLLLTLGGTFFLAFGPLLLITVAFFSVFYFYFGPTFIHDASNSPVSPPPYVDPYALLEDERINQMRPPLN